MNLNKTSDTGAFEVQVVIGGHTGRGFLSSFEGYVHKEMVKAEADIKARLLMSAREESHRYKHQTRNLRNATKVKGELTQRKGLVLYIDLNQASYGKYIVEGQRSWKPDSFIEKSIADNEEWIQQRLQKALDKAVVNFNRR